MVINSKTRQSSCWHLQKGIKKIPFGLFCRRLDSAKATLLRISMLKLGHDHVYKGQASSAHQALWLLQSRACSDGLICGSAEYVS